VLGKRAPSRQMVVCLDHSRLGYDGWRRISGRPDCGR
jgi:hypothetical protein